MALDFYYFFENLRAYGVYDYLLPFLLIFVVLFAIVEKTRIFGQNKTNINIVFSLLVSAIVIFNTNVVDTILGYLPGISLVVVVAVGFMLVFAMLASGGEFRGFPFAVALIAALVAVFISLSSTEFGAGLPFFQYYLPEGLFTFLVIAALVAAIIAVIVRGNRNHHQGRPLRLVQGD